MKNYCPECGKISNWDEVTRPEVFEIRGEPIEVDVSLLKCQECGAEFEDMNSESDPYSLAYEEYRKRHEMVQPNQIRDFREKYNLTQKELSGLLGFGSVTLSRYENGALQDDVHDQLLKLIFKPSNLLKTINEKPKVLLEDKRNLLIQRLNKESQIDFYITLTSNNELNIFNGFKLPEINKLVETIKFFTFSQSVFKTKLLKLLFYADFKHYKNNDQSITGLQYARLPFGPAPEDYEYLLGIILKTEPAFSVESKTLGSYNGEVLITNTPADPKVLNREELRTLRFVQDYFSSFSTIDIEEYSHKEKGYIETEHCKLISYEFAKELSI